MYVSVSVCVCVWGSCSPPHPSVQSTALPPSRCLQRQTLSGKAQAVAVATQENRPHLVDGPSVPANTTARWPRNEKNASCTPLLDILCLLPVLVSAGVQVSAYREGARSSFATSSPGRRRQQARIRKPGAGTPTWMLRCPVRPGMEARNAVLIFLLQSGLSVQRRMSESAGGEGGVSLGHEWRATQFAKWALREVRIAAVVCEANGRRRKQQRT